MAYLNLASVTKLHRASHIITDIGTSGLMQIYTGSAPASPDITATGTLLATLPLSATAAVASLGVLSGVVTAIGSGGTDGVYTLTVTGGGGTGVAGTFTVLGGVLSSIAISNNGSGFTAAPTFSGFSSAGLSGATAIPVMTGILVFNAISTATAVATGNAGYARITTSGGVGIIDLDVGTTNAYSVVMGNTFINSGGPVSCSAEILIEA